jgi:hypothetical protein
MPPGDDVFATSGFLATRWKESSGPGHLSCTPRGWPPPRSPYPLALIFSVTFVLTHARRGDDRAAVLSAAVRPSLRCAAVRPSLRCAAVRLSRRVPLSMATVSGACPPHHHVLRISAMMRATQWSGRDGAAPRASSGFL